MGNGMHPKSCGAIREKEMKAKAEIKRLQALNRKIKADCERKSKEMAQKLQSARRTIASLKSKLAAALATITKLKQQVSSLKSALAAQKVATTKQRHLKEDFMAKYKSEEKVRKAAEAKVAHLTKQLALVTAKYNKLRGTMKHINVVSNTPKK